MSDFFFKTSKLIIFCFLILIFASSKVSAILPGDANADGTVDGLDYVIWLNNYNQTVSNGTTSGDFDANGFVDGQDYMIWRTNYGTTNPTATPGNLTPTSGPSPTPPIGNKITYTSSPDDITNPERGFMKHSNIFVDQALDPNKIKALIPSDTVVWVEFRLDNYRDPRDGIGVVLPDYRGKLLEPLGSGKGLDTIKTTFATARSKGLKLLIQFGYNWGPGSSPDPTKVNPDVPLNLALQHIDQLKSLIIENSDVIAAMQGGFIGHWGEWHSSKYMSSLQDRKKIVDALLVALPKDRMLMIRYPRYKQALYGGPIKETESYTQSAISRIGNHNACFLAGTNDAGTYLSSVAGIKISTLCDNSPLGEIQCWKEFVSKDSLYTPQAGETCQYNPPRSDCSNALQELTILHWSLLNNDYRPEVLNSWVSGGCMPEIRRRLGYRIELKEATLPSSVKAGSALNLNIKLRNVGFASIYNPRPVYLVLSGSNRYEIPISGLDPRRWAPSVDSTISQSINIPVNVSPGTYKLAIFLPDASASLKNNPAYSVRFANSNVWEAAAGLNILTNIQIQP